MDFCSSHRYERPFEELSAAFFDPDAHVARYALMDASDIETLEVATGEGTLDLKTLRTVQGEVPKMAQKFIAATNTVTATDHWERNGGGLIGHSTIEASNVPGVARIAATLEADGDGACTYGIDLALELKVPLIGDRFVMLLRPQVMEIINAEFEAWERWFSSSPVAVNRAS